MRDVFVAELSALAQADPRIFLITGDLGFGVLSAFEERFPHQYLNAGVAEQNMTGMATGLALEGRIVFTYSIANFPTLRCLEQIRNDAAYHGANVKIVAVGGGFSYGALGMSHHATEDLAILRAIPAITVVAPGDDWETSGATRAIVETPGTCYLRLDRSSAPSTAQPGDEFVLGRARQVLAGDDLTIIATGGILGVVLQVAETLAARGVHCRVISMHTLRPFDSEAVIQACMETGGVVTVEEHVVTGGLAGAVGECCLEHGVAPRAFASVGMRAGFSSIVGSQDYLRERYGMNDTAILHACERVLSASAKADVAQRLTIV